MKIQSLPSNLKGVYDQWKLVEQVHNLVVEQKWLECIGLAKELSSGQENDIHGEYYQGICHTQLKFYEEAITNFEKALLNIQKNKIHWAVTEYEEEARLRLAHVYRLQRKYEKATELLDQLIATHPKYVNAYQSKAGIQIDQNDFNGALRTANMGLSQLPNHQELLELRNSMVYELTAKS
ncbi:MAG: tetratricopeptide repeat protein [Cyclobacteriaceae bacterium]